MNINAWTGGTTATTSAASPATSNAVSGSTPDFAAMFKALTEEATKTPEERAREGVLKKHDLSEQDYRALPQDQRKAIDTEITDAVRRVAEQRRANMAAQNGSA